MGVNLGFSCFVALQASRIIGVTKLRRMRWAGRVAQLGEISIQYFSWKIWRKETNRNTYS